MRKLLNKPWFVAVLAIAAAAFVAHAVLSQRASLPGYGAQTATLAETADNGTPAGETGGVTPLSPGRPATADLLKELSASGTARNPFLARARTVVAAAAEKHALPDETDSIAVAAVWIQSGVAYALANGHVFKSGDQLGRLRIESIDRDGLWLSHWKGRTFVIVGSAFTLTTSAKQAAALAGASQS